MQLEHIIDRVRVYLTTRWWMPLVLFWTCLIGGFIVVMQTLKWTGVFAL